MSNAIEVELKARVSDLAAVEERLRGRARFLDEISYTDYYFTPAGTSGFSFHRFRLRQSEDRALVTFKEKLVGHERGVHEHEFEVSDAEAFLDFARKFGFQLMLTKTKQGRRYRLDPAAGSNSLPATVELVRIGELGDFVEIEVMVFDPAVVPQAEARLKEVLHELGLPEAAIESRAYTKLLYDQKHGGEKKP